MKVITTLFKTMEKNDEWTEDNNMGKYYSIIQKQGWRPLHLDVERDVKRWNCENQCKNRLPDHHVYVIMPPETTTEEALLIFSSFNELNIQERLIQLLNMYPYI